MAKGLLGIAAVMPKAAAKATTIARPPASKAKTATPQQKGKQVAKANRLMMGKGCM